MPEQAMPARVAALFQEHHRTLVRRVTRYTRCPELAEDAVMETWRIAVTKLSRVAPGEELPWLTVVARHEAFALLRKRRHEVAEDHQEYEARDGQPELALEAREALDALAALKPNQRRALSRKVAGLSYDEIGAEQGRGFTWANRHITEGRAALRAREGAVSVPADTENPRPARGSPIGPSSG